MLLGKEVSKASIAKILGVSRSALYHFIETRKIGPRLTRKPAWDSPGFMLYFNTNLGATPLPLMGIGNAPSCAGAGIVPRQLITLMGIGNLREIRRSTEQNSKPHYPSWGIGNRGAGDRTRRHR